jgi:hypothetical protein
MFYVFGILWVLFLAAMLVGGYEYVCWLRRHE